MGFYPFKATFHDVDYQIEDFPEQKCSDRWVCLAQMVRGMSAGARVFEYMTLEATISLRGGGQIPHGSLTGRVDFLNVDFR